MKTADFNQRSRGNILISVLWIIVILVVLVFGMGYEARSDMERTRLYRDRAKAYWLSRAAVERVKYDYTLSQMAGGLDGDEEYEKTTFYRYDFAEGYAECKIKSSGSLMSVNTQNFELWKQLFTYYTDDEQLADEITDAIKDWTDADDMESLNGAETEYYSSLSPSYQPPNGPMFSIEELLLIRGITDEFFYGPVALPDGGQGPGLKDLVTVSANRRGKFDINTCPTAILMAFLDIDEQQAREIDQMRNEKMFDNPQELSIRITLDDPGLLNKFFSVDRGSQFTIVSTGFVYDSPARYTVESEVQYTGNGKLFRNLSHKDFSLNHVDKVPMDEEFLEEGSE